MEQLNFEETVDALTDPNRPPHLLAMDQSAGTHRKHFKNFGIEIEDDADFKRNAAQIRTAICTTPELGRYFGGAIQADDAYALKGPDGRPLMDYLRESGVIPIGKKCGLDPATGLIPEADLDALPSELQMLVNIGINAVKIRATAKITLEEHTSAVAEQMVRIHEMCAQNGQIIPILEPEFEIANPGTLSKNEDLMGQVLGEMCRGISDGAYPKHPYIVKTSFPTPGKGCETESINTKRSAAAFARILDNEDIPPEILFRFLSGGHSPSTSRILYREIATRSALKERVGTSFSRAILESTYKAGFKDGRFDQKGAQDEISRQGMLNMLAQRGTYDYSMEEQTLDEIQKVAQIN
ncbi:fructose-bisphosphate aldolase [Patescibacteria group bacterium]|nr:fructose-bisphosphate aldolase [Patescibacteria group bacterium]